MVVRRSAFYHQNALEPVWRIQILKLLGEPLDQSRLDDLLSQRHPPSIFRIGAAIMDA